MKNLKKIVLGLMLLLAVFAFVGCPTPEQPAPTPTPEQPAGGNEGPEQKIDLKGLCFVGHNNMMGFRYIACIEFVDDANAIYNETDYDYENGKPVINETPISYSLENDVITMTIHFEEEPETYTAKLENNKFEYVVFEEGYEDMPITITWEKTDKPVLEVWEYWHGERFLLDILSEIDNFRLEENTDYTVDTTNKKISLTDVGEPKSEYWTKIFGEDQNTILYYEIMEIIKECELIENEDYILDYNNYKFTLHESASTKMEAIYWTVIYGDQEFTKGLKEDCFKPFEMLGFVEIEDYTVDNEERIIAFTDVGYIKFAKLNMQILITYENKVLYMDDELESVMELILGYGLEEGTDYTIAEDEQEIILTDVGYEKYLPTVPDTEGNEE